MKIGVIGRGTVGDAVFNGLEGQGHDMSFFDVKWPDSRLEHVLDTECVFVVVPTDSTETGHCDTSIIERVIQELSDAAYQGLICIKSTVIPGTTNRLQAQYPHLQLACVPEFLRARMALADFVYNHDLLVIGTENSQHFELVKKIHGFIPRHVAQVKPVEAEIIKYFNNVHHAVQVTFANIMYEICGQMDASYDAVYGAMIKRDCINPHYLLANEKFRGFGGHCLPKDTRALDNLIRDLGLEFEMIGTVLKDNDRINNG